MQQNPSIGMYTHSYICTFTCNLFSELNLHRPVVCVRVRMRVRVRARVRARACARACVCVCAILHSANITDDLLEI